MNNPGMLLFLAAVATHARRPFSEGGHPLGVLAGYDSLELAVAVSAATRAGLIEPDDTGQPPQITARGWRWAAGQMLPLGALLAGPLRAARDAVPCHA